MEMQAVSVTLSVIIVIVLVINCGLHTNGRGLIEESDADPCTIYPCQNGGTCRLLIYDQLECGCSPNWKGHSCEIESDIDGQVENSTTPQFEFIFGFPENYKQKRGPKLMILSRENNATVRISLQRIEFFKTVVLGVFDKKIIQLPLAAMAHGSGMQNVAILIQSTNDITVYGINDNHVASGDGFLALPTTSLGTEYYAIGACDSRGFKCKSQFLIVGVEDDTLVSIYLKVPVATPTGSYLYRRKYLQLNRLDMMQFQSDLDLTGSSIQSNKPVSVLSGSQCGCVNSNNIYIGNSCEHMVVHLPTVRHWGRRHIVTPLHGSGGETTVRIIAFRGTTVIPVGGEEHNIGPFFVSRDLGWEMFKDIKLTGDKPVFLISFNPVLMVTYVSNVADECRVAPPKSCKIARNTGHGLTLISPVEHFTTEAIFSTFNRPNVNSQYTLNIVGNCDVRQKLILNGTPLPRTTKEIWKADAEIANYCSLRHDVEPHDNTFYLQSVSPEAKFSATLVVKSSGSTIALTSRENLVTDVSSKDSFASFSSEAISSGTEFIFGFTTSCNCSTIAGPRVIVVSDSSTNETRVEITALNGEFNKTFWLFSGSSVSIDLPATVIALGAYGLRPPAAIHVKTSHPVTVYGINDAYDSRSDGFLVRPTDSLGMEYIAVSSWSKPHGAINSSGGQYLIIGIYDDTFISMNPSSYYKYKLNRLEAFSQKYSYSVLGERIIATKPVAVISGSDCGFSQGLKRGCNGCYYWPCDHMVEHVPPVSHWGRQIVVTSFEGYEAGKTLIHVIAARDMTTVFLRGRNYPLYLSAGESSFLYLGPSTVNSTVISSNQPIAIAAMSGYGPLPSCNTSDECQSNARPVMTLVPPLKPLRSRVTFQFQDLRDAQDLRNYAYLITECSQAGEIFVNNKTVEDSWRREPIEASEYCVYRLEIERIVYEMWTTSDSVKLCAIQYGFSSRSGFAFPLT